MDDRSEGLDKRLGTFVIVQQSLIYIQLYTHVAKSQKSIKDDRSFSFIYFVIAQQYLINFQLYALGSKVENVLATVERMSLAVWLQPLKD